ncbi:MAG: UDP-N-acetylmuramoyl-L-alanine--D-glutamate ligase [Ilumatobacter sp.]|uniref:UDP-N-acetylmuramoyl-L-alanine--D-glutamate ligase n=1 Tax=Ilumatobacter sp. TaxID=1967498 RepID=UPI00391A1DC6
MSDAPPDSVAAGNVETAAPRALVYGLAVTGVSTARALLRRGYDVVAADDAVTPERAAVAAELGIPLLDAPDDATLADLVDECELVSPAPGIPETHRVVRIALQAGADVVSEIELAYRWEQLRPGGPRPMLAVTGTDGKTTTTLMTVAMLQAAGLSTVDAGNTATPLVDAIEDDHDAFVVECTSFRLAWTPSFRAEAAAWLNLAPDHLDWHRNLETYEDAKFRIWINQRTSDTAVGFARDATVMRRIADAPGRVRTFGADDADYRLERRADGDVLVGPHGDIVRRDAMRRSLPHDVTNALAASALVLESGLADEGAIASALASFVGPRHRLEHVGRWNDIDWFNDSKATTPHAAAVAIAGFDDLVLIAGGKDKGVDLAEMAVGAHHVRAVIGIATTAPSIAEAFASVPIVETRATLTEAVDLAAQIARPGDTVLLSPGCASLDQYPSFEARGDEFVALVERLHRLPRSAANATSDPTSTGAP